MSSRDENLILQRWYPVVNDTLTGWTVCNVDKRPKVVNEMLGEQAALILESEAIARHIADVHNEWLDRQASS